MAFCPNCGAQAAGAFCPNCGTALPSGPAGPGTSAGTGAGPGAGAGYVPPARPVSAPGMTDNVAGALCYLFWFVTGIIFLVIAPYNQSKLVRFHAFQSIFASIAVIIISIIISLIMGAVFFSGGGFWAGFMIHRIWDLLVFIGWLYMMFSTYNNKRVKLPVVGDLAEKQA